VLVLDDWGLAPVSDLERRNLLEVIEDRHGNRSTVLTSVSGYSSAFLPRPAVERRLSPGAGSTAGRGGAGTGAARRRSVASTAAA
jgi:hypothetical protein